MTGNPDPEDNKIELDTKVDVPTPDNLNVIPDSEDNKVAPAPGENAPTTATFDDI